MSKMSGITAGMRSYRYFIWSSLLLWLALSPGFTRAADIWVSVKGSDRNPGTKEQPLASVHAALRKARELRRLNNPAVEGGIHIIVRGGHYFFSEPLFVRPEDSGTAAAPTVVEAAAGEHPVFSGGIELTGWKKASGEVAGLPGRAKGKVWVTDAPVIAGEVLNFRQLWADDRKAVRARNSNTPFMDRIISWDHASETCVVPASAVKDVKGGEGLEMFIHQWWAIAILRVKSVQKQGSNARLTFYQPESHIQSEHPWPAPWISEKTGNSAFYLSNAIQFLDEPGEWYLDRANRKVYYWPLAHEALNRASVIVPYLETIVRMEGTIDKPVSYFNFKGISFQHAGWLRPSTQGHVPLQAGMFLLDAYKLKVPGTPEKKGLENQGWTGRPRAAVEASFTSHTAFDDCRFEHLASTGLDYKRGNYNDRIEGNLFKDIGGSGILTGVFSDDPVEAHLSYNPANLREVSTNTTISNNLITDVTNEDWGSVGIGAGFVRGIKIVHNDISEVSYSGISLGWGWTREINVMRDNQIRANRIHHYARNMYDVAAVYTLSAQPGSEISENYIDSIYKAPYSHDPHHWFYLYEDEGSSYFTVRDNWCPAGKFLQNANGPGNVWTNNGPQVADSVRLAAGLQSQYKAMLSFRGKPTGEIKSVYRHIEGLGAKPMAIEIINADNRHLDSELIRSICRQHGIASTSIYEWNNHIVIFDEFLSEADKIRKKLALALPQATVKFYEEPFYSFSLRKSCTNGVPATEWQHIILTANLADDPKLQKEYMDLHASQAVKWPEVAKGFCNAQFQEVLVFRNERQLLLVISLPKGKALEDLNPLTTKDNPRAAQWNELMKKYQRPVAGAAGTETWVRFQSADQLKD